MNNLKYLGVYIIAGQKIRCDYTRARMSFYQSSSAICSKCKSASCELICNNLLKSYCLPVVLYAREALCLNSRNMVVLNKAIDSGVDKIFGTYLCMTPVISHTRILGVLCSQMILYNSVIQTFCTSFFYRI